MTDSVSTELNVRPLKIPKFHKACEGSKSSNKQRVLKVREVDNDEYVRQYLLFHYQFKKSEGFTIDWEQFDYVFRIRSFDNPPRRLSDTRSNAELIREETLFAIEKQNKAKIASVDVEPPSPMQCDDFDEIAVVFARAGHDDDLGVPFPSNRRWC